MTRSHNHKKYCGIYQIKNAVNDKYYIGSSVNIKNRWYGHTNRLRNGRHGNKYLQASWDKYGKSAFVFEIVEECPEELLVEREQYYIDSLNPEYNLNPVAGRPPDNSRNPVANAKRSAYAKRRVHAGEFGPPPKPVIRTCIFTGNQVYYESTTAAEKDGFIQQSVSACCNYKKNTYKNSFWRFVGDTTPFPEVKRLQFIPIIRIGPSDEIVNYASRKEIIDDGFDYDRVKRVCRKTYGRKTYQGYGWRYARAEASKFTH